MKTFAAILSFYILSLLVLPSFVSLKLDEKKAHCKKTCCHNVKPCEKKNEKKKDNACQKGNCTPFFGCSNLHFVIPKTITLTFKPIYLSKHF